MIQLILVVIICAIGYSFIRTKNELKKKQEKIDSINAKKDVVIEKSGIKEKISAQDKEENVYILSEDNNVFIFKSKEDKIEKIDGIKSIDSKRRYATIKSG